MKKIRIFVMLFAFLSLGIISWIYFSKKSIDDIPDKAVLVMNTNTKIKAIFIIR